MKKGFSLVEVLVALGVLAIVAAIVVPRFLGIQGQAQDAVAQQMASQLNHTFAQWTASGGAVGGNVATSDLLYVLSGNGGSDLNVTRSDPSGNVADGGSSNNIRVNLTAEVAATLPVPAADPLSVVSAGNFLIKYMNDKQSFVVVRQDDPSAIWYTYMWPLCPQINPGDIAGWSPSGITDIVRTVTYSNGAKSDQLGYCNNPNQFAPDGSLTFRERDISAFVGPVGASVELPATSVSQWHMRFNELGQDTLHDDLYGGPMPSSPAAPPPTTTTTVGPALNLINF